MTQGRHLLSSLQTARWDHRFFLRTMKHFHACLYNVWHFLIVFLPKPRQCRLTLRSSNRFLTMKMMFAKRISTVLHVRFAHSFVLNFKLLIFDVENLKLVVMILVLRHLKILVHLSINLFFSSYIFFSFVLYLVLLTYYLVHGSSDFAFCEIDVLGDLSVVSQNFLDGSFDFFLSSFVESDSFSSLRSLDNGMFLVQSASTGNRTFPNIVLNLLL